MDKELTREYFLTAGETDAQGKMQMWLIVERAIELATLHANALGIGYSRLITMGIGWVLTRISVEMTRYPGINETYRMTTWIEGYNRLYSDRCFVITDIGGNEIGHIRSTWVAIDMDKRTTADLTAIERERFPISDRPCPVERQGKQRPLGDDAAETEYTFRYSDIDFNRHVNTVQYIRHILNLWDVDFFDRHSIARFDITFHNECHYGETVSIRHTDPEPLTTLVEIVDSQGRRAVTSRLRFSETKDGELPAPIG